MPRSAITSCAMLIAPDAAAPFAGELPDRDDLAIFVAHPWHPLIFNDEVELVAKVDHFGGVAAKQHVVCALMRGSQGYLELGEDVALRMCVPASAHG